MRRCDPASFYARPAPISISTLITSRPLDSNGARRVCTSSRTACRLESGSAAVGLSVALATGVYPFVLADLAKLAAAAGITPGLWRLIGTR